MIIYKDLKAPFIEEAESLTIGFFDGLHLGHQFLLKKLEESKGKKKSALVSFSNHPISFFSKKPFPLIFSLTQKLAFLQEYSIDYLFLFPFNKKMADTPFSIFLKDIQKVFPFKKLILGKNAVFGKNREGTKEAVEKIAPSLSFEPFYFTLEQKEGTPFSSSNIREKIQKGDLASVEPLLGRKYSIWVDSWRFLQKEKASFFAPDLCLPPSGKYRCKKQNFSVEILEDKTIQIFPFSEAGPLPLEFFLEKEGSSFFS